VVGDVSCLSAGHNRDMQKRLNRSNAVWSMDSGGTKKPSVGCKARVPQGKGAFRGTFVPAHRKLYGISGVRSAVDNFNRIR